MAQQKVVIAWGFITSALSLMALIALIMFGLSSCDWKDDKYIITGTVVDVGTCSYSDSSRSWCATNVDREDWSTNDVWMVTGGVIEGMTVYKHCWIYEETHWCQGTAYSHRLTRWQ